MQDLEVAIEYAHIMSPVLSTLATEQKSIGGYIWSSEGDPAQVSRAKNDMLLDREESDKAIEQFLDFVQNNEESLTANPHMAGELEAVKLRLDELRYVRLAADTKKPSSDAYKDVYSSGVIWTTGDVMKIRMVLVQSISRIAEIASADKKLGMISDSLYFLHLAGSASVEVHNYISTAVAQIINVYQYAQLQSYKDREMEYRNMFTKYASDSAMETYHQLMIASGAIGEEDKVFWDIFELHEQVGTKVAELKRGGDWAFAAKEVPIAYKTLIQTVLDELVAIKNDKVSEAETLVRSSILWAAVLIILILAVSYLIAMSISKPLRQLVRSFISLAKNKDMSLHLDDHGKNELADLSNAFNTLVDSFNEALVGIRTHATSMNSTNTQTADAMRKALDLSHSQMCATDSISVAVNEMTASIQEVSNMSQSTSSTVQKAHEVSLASVEEAEKSRGLLEGLTQELGNTAKVIETLNQEANQISGVLNVIQSIAEQTNLLALNAAIEAARAGESGRGFAVVADEVRGLAKRTQESTEQIRDQVSSLLSGANSATTNMTKLQEEGTQAVEIVMGTVEEFNVLKKDLDVITEKATQIAVASEEQTSVSNEINQRICAIKDDSEQLAEYASTTMSMTELVEDEGRQLQEHIDRFKTE